MTAQPFTHHAEGSTILTPRGQAAARLSDFQDVWAQLTAEDRAWFARWLSDLLLDACEQDIISSTK